MVVKRETIVTRPLISCHRLWEAEKHNGPPAVSNILTHFLSIPSLSQSSKIIV